MQHSRNNQTDVYLVQRGQTVTEIDGNAAGDTRRDPQHAALAARARQPISAKRLDRRRPVNDRQHPIADHRRANPHEPAHELVTPQPTLVADQQLNSRLDVIEPLRVHPQRRREVLDAGSKSVLPSTALITITFSIRWVGSRPGDS
jgi:hypothetical protein